MFPAGNSKYVSESGGSSSTGSGTPSRPAEKSKRKGRDLGNGFEEWGGYMNAKKQKLAEQFNSNQPKDGSSSDIFHGVSIYVNGYTNPSSDELKRLMRRHGGNYEQYLYKTRVTHVIATRLPNSKVNEIKSGDKIVKPEWILDSIKAGRLLSYEPYQLYTAQSSIQRGITRFTSTKNSEAHPCDTSTESIFNNQLGEGSTTPDNSKVDGEGETSPQLFTPSPETPTCTDGVHNHQKQTDTAIDKTFKSPFHFNVSASAESSFSSSSHFAKKEVEQEQKVHGRPSSIAPSTNTGKSPVKSNYNGGQRTTSVAGDSTFVSDFYQHSRLHHLSTWKCEFAEYVNHLQVSSDGTYTGREKLMQLHTENSVRGMQAGETTMHSSKGKPQRVIMHVDMDCFFVSVGLRERPELKGKPIAVTHSKGKGAKLQPGASRQLEKVLWESQRSKRAQNRSGTGSRLSLSKASTEDNLNDVIESEFSKERPDLMAILNGNTTAESEDSEFYSMADIASCSYEARQAGVKNGMSVGGAKKLCPDLVTIPYDFEKYNEVSRQLYAIVASYTHDIEAVSCDEMLVDCTDLLADVGVAPLDFATVLRQEIFEKTKCTASVGLGPNILTAKMATRKAKPNGQFCLSPADVFEFMCPQLVKDLPGIGWAMTKRLGVMGIKTCIDMQKIPTATLQKEFGPKLGQSLFRYCRGQDDRPIKVEKERKSVSAEINYGIRFKQDHEAAKFLTELSEEVHNRLVKINSKGKSITLKLKVRREDAPVETAKFLGHGVCNQVSKSVTLPLATDNPQLIAKEVIDILKSLKVNAADLRGIGIQMQKLEPATVGPGSSSRGHQSILSFTVPKPQKPHRQLDSKKSPVDSHKSPDDSHKPTFDSHKSPVDSHKSPVDSHKSPFDSHKSPVDSHKSPVDSHKSGIDSHQNLSNLHINSTVDSCEIQNDSHEIPLELRNLRSAESAISLHGSPHQIEMDSCKAMTNLHQSVNDSHQQVISLPDSDHPRAKFTQLKPASSTRLFIPGHKVDPPLPALPSLTSPELMSSPVSHLTTPGRRETGGNDAQDYFPSPSQVDPEVLKELPADIREQIESAMNSRQKSKQNTATCNQLPQPVIVQEEVPGCSHWSSQEPVSKADVKEDLIGLENDAVTEPGPGWSTPKISSQIVSLPSPSQVDPDVLKELPTDIREQIESAMKTRQVRKESMAAHQTSKPITEPERDNGTPHLAAQDPAPKPCVTAEAVVVKNNSRPQRRTRASEKIVPLPSLSQLDMDCLNALPEELQREIQQAYAVQGKHTDTARSSSPGRVTAWTTIMSSKNSPSKKSPGKKGKSPSKRRSPQFKIPQGKPGRKKRQSSKKLDFTRSGLEKPASRDVEEIPGPCFSSDVIIVSDDIPNITFSVPETLAEPETAEVTAVNLCGRVTATEVKVLLREWLQSCPVPDSEDIQVIVQYFGELVLDKNLELADLLLKFLRRQVNRLSKNSWSTALMNIITNTQDIIFSQHGSRLKGFNL